MQLGFLALAELLGMTLWFSASAVVPTLQVESGLSSAAAAWLTMSVQIGFVAGTLLSAFLNLPDIVSSTMHVSHATVPNTARQAGSTDIKAMPGFVQ